MLLLWHFNLKILEKSSIIIIACLEGEISSPIERNLRKIEGFFFKSLALLNMVVDFRSSAFRASTYLYYNWNLVIVFFSFSACSFSSDAKFSTFSITFVCCSVDVATSWAPADVSSAIAATSSD